MIYKANKECVWLLCRNEKFHPTQTIFTFQVIRSQVTSHITLDLHFISDLLVNMRSHLGTQALIILVKPLTQAFTLLYLGYLTTQLLRNTRFCHVFLVITRALFRCGSAAANHSAAFQTWRAKPRGTEPPPIALFCICARARARSLAPSRSV